jgi:hypothetical protein|tara:strand:- start:2074 stop:2604 length:531 start_codon:yes stop_codon:yes gene_type:complete
MGDYTLNNLGSTSNADTVTSNDQGLVDSMLSNLTGGGGGTDNVTEYSSVFIASAYFTYAKTQDLAGLTDAVTNLWTWKVPYNYSLTEFSVVANEITSLTATNKYTLYAETAASRGGSWTTAATTTMNGSNPAVHTYNVLSNVDVSANSLIRVRLVKAASAQADLQILLKFKMAHVG